MATVLKEELGWGRRKKKRDRLVMGGRHPPGHWKMTW
jgi:hypothetical protein